MAKNGDGKGDEKDKIRDENGRFLPGKPGGPGRGNTRKKQERSEAVDEMKALLLDDNADLTNTKALAPLGRALYYEIMSDDAKVSAGSKKLYFLWLGKMYEAEEREKAQKEGLPSPGVVNSFARAVAIKQDLDVMEAEGITDLLCIECKKKLGVDGDGLKEGD